MDALEDWFAADGTDGVHVWMDILVTARGNNMFPCVHCWQTVLAQQ
jgi:hypothetical protein